MTPARTFRQKKVRTGTDKYGRPTYETQRQIIEVVYDKGGSPIEEILKQGGNFESPEE